MKKIILIVISLMLAGCMRYQYTPEYFSTAPMPSTPKVAPKPVNVSFVDANRTVLTRTSKEALKELAADAHSEQVSIYSNANGAVAVADFMSQLGHNDSKLLHTNVSDMNMPQTVAFTGNTWRVPSPASAISIAALRIIEQENIAIKNVEPETPPVPEPEFITVDTTSAPADTAQYSNFWLYVLIIVFASLGLGSFVIIRHRRIAVLGMVLILSAPSAFAASADRDNALETFRSIQQSQQLEQFMDTSTIAEKDTATVPVKKDEKKIVTLHKIVITKSTILPDEFFASLRKKYLNRRLSASEVSAIAAEINDEYSRLGYPAARAFLPKQDITEGVLHISLIEGKIDKVKYSGNDWTSDIYLDRFFNIPTGDHVLMSPIELQVLNFNAHNDAKARVSLEPGEKYGTTDIDIILDEPDLVSAMAFVDNGGQKETGMTRYGLSGALNGITGYRDVLSVGLIGASGMTSWFGSYEIPDPWIGARWGFGYDHSDTQIIAGQLEVLSVKGNYDNMYLYMKKPFWVRGYTVSHVNFNLANKRGESSIQEFLTQTNNTSVATVSVDNTLMYDGMSIFNSLSLAQGLSMFGADASFTSVSYFGEGQFQLLRDLALNVRLRVAYMSAGGDSVVPSTEKMQIGGANSVRGYKESIVMTDFGAYGSLELRYNISRYMPDWARTNAIVFGFFDYGEIFDDNSFINIEADAPKNLASVGLGLRAAITEYLSGTLTFSQTLITNALWPENDSQFLFFVSTRF